MKMKRVSVWVLFLAVLFLLPVECRAEETIAVPATDQFGLGGAVKGISNKPTTLDESLSPVGNNAITPAVAMDDRGNAIVAWSQYDGRFWRIFKSEYRDNVWHKPASITDFVSPDNGDATNPKVAMAENGDRIIVWEQSAKQSRYILMSENRDGKWRQPASTDEHISPGDSFSWEPDLAMDDLGNTVVVWNQEYLNGFHAVYKSEYRKGSWQHPASTKEAISPAGDGDALRPQVAMNNRGEALIAWTQDPVGVSRIYKSEYRHNTWTHPVDSNDCISPKTKQGGANTPVLAMDDNGRVVIAWQQSDGANARIYLSEYRGNSWQHPKSLTDAVSPITVTNAQINSIGMDNRGNTLLLWTSQQMRNQALFVSAYRDGVWKHPGENDFFIGSKSDYEFRIFGKVAMSASGKAVIVWQQMGDDSISRVFMSEFDNGLWRLPGKKISILDTPAINGAIAASKNGNFVVVWQQRNGQFDQIYKSEFR